MQIYARNSSKLFFARSEDAEGKLNPRVFASFHLSRKTERKINKNVLTDVDLKIKINKKSYIQNEQFFGLARI